MTGTNSNQMPNGWRIIGWGLALALLLAPLLAMQISSEMNWGLGDFLAAATLILGTGLAVELAVRLARRAWLREMLSLAAFLAFAAIWAELAVGLLD